MRWEGRGGIPDTLSVAVLVNVTLTYRKMMLVDLAGSERMKRSGVEGEAAREHGDLRDPVQEVFQERGSAASD